MTSDSEGSRSGGHGGRWLVTAALSWLLLVYLLLASEWLFQVTKISFLSYLPWTESVRVLVLAPLPVVVVGWTAMAMGSLPAALGAVGKLLARWSLALLPACLLTGLAFLLVDNFTMTVFGFGSLTQRGPTRFVYAALLAVAWTAAMMHGLDAMPVRGRPKAPTSRRRLGALLLAASATGWLLLPFVPGHGVERAVSGGGVTLNQLPDVLLLSAEGLGAEQFGGLFEGTGAPELPTLSRDALVLQNAFANANRTAGSVPVVVTGRHPTTVHKLNGRHGLRGADSYRHLPGLLAGLGYRSYLQGPRLHVDPVAWNLRRGFDVYNGRPVDPGGIDAMLAAADGRLDSTAYFLELVGRRLGDRLFHVVGVNLAELPSRPNDTPPNPDAFADMEDFLHSTERPVLLMAHLVGRPTDHDLYLRRLLDSQRDRRRPLLAIFWSDHGPNHDAELRTPLLLRLPAGVDPSPVDLRADAQNLDIVPTVLDVLGVELPEWLEGTSLLRPRSHLRPIFIVSSSDLELGLPVTGVALGGPRRLALVVCQRLATLDLLTGTLDVRDVVGHADPCAEPELPTGDEMRALLLEHLRQRGYPVEQIP